MSSDFCSTYCISVLYRTALWPVWFLAEVYLSKSVVKMHVKSIILEGFKSYAQRTEVNGFDPLFNAITGLNGSGKSNILDSICFLLGISNLSQVNLLIYVNYKLRSLKRLLIELGDYCQCSLHLHFMFMWIIFFLNFYWVFIGLNLPFFV